MDTTRPSLLIRIRDRSDEAAWRAFDAIYRPMLLRFAKAHHLPDAEAEDVAQHCLSAFNRKLDEFEYDRGRGRFKGWLRTLVNNRVRNLWRDRRNVAALNGTDELTPDLQEQPDQAFERIWMEEHLWHCLRELQTEVDPGTFAAYEAYVLKQEPAEQICARLGISRGNLHTIKWRLTERVAVKMRELLGEHEQDEIILPD
ncbi:MAG: RNA polymerase sigma factor [Phycisphaerae bacterium]